MDKLYLVELIEYHFDSKAECIDQEQAEVIGLYDSKSLYKARVELEINNYKLASKTAVEIFRDDNLVDGCMEAIDIVSKDARVTLLVTEVSLGDSKRKIDYNRINYYVDYDKSGEFDKVKYEI